MTIEALADLETDAALPLPIALDLFAGTGWGVACRRLGIQEFGVELMPEAVATREANGMETIFRDVWEGLDRPQLISEALRERRRGALDRIHDGTADAYDLLVASPPCQTFSVAGNGAGRRALNEVLQAIAERDYLDPAALKAFGEKHDERTALVLSPLAYVARDLPRVVVFEQVPQVLPVWEACAEVMRGWGYSVVTAVLNSEQYGVPQTRKRAILIGRWDAEAKMPTPTHSAYYPRDPKRLDPGVLPWVSMAEALGWDADGVAGFARRADEGEAVTIGGVDYRARDLRPTSLPAQHVTEKARSWSHYRMAGAGATAAVTAQQRQRPTDEPAHTITGAGSAAWVQERHRGAGMLERHGSRPARPVEHPALTITGNASGTTPGGFAVRPVWPEERPATTIQGDAQVWPPGHKVNADDRARLGDAEADARYGDRAGTHAGRVSVAEAAALQSYPGGFRWDVDYDDPRGGKRKPVSQTKRYLQIGNAVPPLLAEAVLRAALA